MPGYISHSYIPCAYGPVWSVSRSGGRGPDTSEVHTEPVIFSIMAAQVSQLQLQLFMELLANS